MNDSEAPPVEEAFRFCPRCGNPSSEIGKIPFQCEKCGMACYFGPVAAVGALITDHQNRLLLVRRARNPGRGKWGLPGGFVDRDETVEQALDREVCEETGLVVTSCRLLMTRPNQYVYTGVRSPVIDLFYCCQVADIDHVALEPSELEHHEWAWPESRHLENMAFDSNRIAVLAWMKEVKAAD
ncbi:GDP-mannose mannosyl hydrolase [Crateriforma conspicua]|uniref:GDP-mannose mannosyl hydrolase n=2 Tax=Planctomycetaceae TaxID=126 RepID=A0A5C6FVY1_9PLAN|nr:GDP-mannose mannosyl hydrolase [Crateriforma conspicua]